MKKRYLCVPIGWTGGQGSSFTYPRSLGSQDDECDGSRGTNRQHQEQRSGIVTGKAAGFLYWPTWSRTGLSGECPAYRQGGTSEPPTAWWMEVRKGCFSSLEKGLTSATYFSLVRWGVSSHREETPPASTVPSRGSQISWKKTVEIRRVSLCSVYRVTKTRFWDSNHDRVSFSSCF